MIGDASVAALRGYGEVAIEFPDVYIYVENDVGGSGKGNIDGALFAGQVVIPCRIGLGRNGEQAVKGDIALRRSYVRAAGQDCVAYTDIASAAANIQNAADAINRNIAYGGLKVQ